MNKCADCRKPIKDKFTYCYQCWNKRRIAAEIADAFKDRIIPGGYLVWDGLRLCSVCGDVETTGDICHNCRRQQWIDKHG